MNEPDEKIDDVEFRAARFGKLPARVHPDDAVATSETEAPRVRPEGAGGEDEWMLRTAAG